MAINEVLLDANVRHQVQLTRLASGIAAELNETLAQYDPDVERITQQIHAGLSVSKLNKIITALQAVNRDAYVDVGMSLTSHMAEVAAYEVGFQSNMIAATLPAEVASQVAIHGPTGLRGVVKTLPINGHTIDEYVEGMAGGRQRRMTEVIRREHAIGGPGVASGIRQGIMGSAAANGMDGVLGLSRRSVEQVTRTVQTGVIAGARDALFKENTDLFSDVLWVSVLDMKTSDLCQYLDGTVFPLDEGPRPPAHYNCRSEITPIVKDWEALGLGDLGPGSRASLTGEVPETMTYPEWLAQQSNAIQDEVLGPARAELFRDGMSIDRFLDETGSRYTLAELRMQEAFRDPGAVYGPGDVQLFGDPKEVQDVLWHKWTDESPFKSLEENINAALGNQVLLADVVKAAVKEAGGTFKDPGIKTDRDRMLQKLQKLDSPSQLTDIVRGGIVVDSPGQADKLIELLGGQLQVGDESWTQTSAGYFDRKAVIHFPNGQVGELQMWQPELLSAKNEGGGYDMYVAWRNLPEGDPGRAVLEQDMRNLYQPILDGLSDEWKDVMKGFVK